MSETMKERIMYALRMKNYEPFKFANSLPRAMELAIENAQEEGVATQVVRREDPTCVVWTAHPLRHDDDVAVLRGVQWAAERWPDEDPEESLPVQVEPVPASAHAASALSTPRPKRYAPQPLNDIRSKDARDRVIFTARLQSIDPEEDAHSTLTWSTDLDELMTLANKAVIHPRDVDYEVLLHKVFLPGYVMPHLTDLSGIEQDDASLVMAYAEAVVCERESKAPAYLIGRIVVPGTVRSGAEARRRASQW